jgi:Zn-dependent protease
MRDLFAPPDEGIFYGNNNDNLELAKAWIGTTLAYAIYGVGASNILTNQFVTELLIAGVVCGLGFVFHELAHRIVARNYGAQAHFVANNGWLLLSIAIAFAGIFIAAPGAVWHRGVISLRQSGLIALAGPVTNLVFALLFLLLWPIIVWTMPDLLAIDVAGESVGFFLVNLCAVGYALNAFIGLFNMIPAGPFDGAKVLAWDRVVFGVTVAVGLVMTFAVRAPTVWRWLGVL